MLSVPLPRAMYPVRAAPHPRTTESNVNPNWASRSIIFIPPPLQPTDTASTHAVLPFLKVDQCQIKKGYKGRNIFISLFRLETSVLTYLSVQFEGLNFFYYWSTFTVPNSGV